jgi:hypothetical protein
MSSQARYLNVLAGLWLFMSAFLWRHSPAQFTNSWVMGIVVAAVALVALSVPMFRYVNTIAGAWLILSTFTLPHVTVATVWNNLIVGFVVLAVSLVPNLARRSSLRNVTT